MLGDFLFHTLACVPREKEPRLGANAVIACGCFRVKRAQRLERARARLQALVLHDRGGSPRKFAGLDQVANASCA